MVRTFTYGLAAAAAFGLATTSAQAVLLYPDQSSFSLPAPTASEWSDTTAWVQFDGTTGIAPSGFDGDDEVIIGQFSSPVVTGFVQAASITTAGPYTIGRLTLGADATDAGFLDISNGTLSVENTSGGGGANAQSLGSFVVGQQGEGTVNQTGGTVNTRSLWVGDMGFGGAFGLDDSVSTQGTYNISAGSLNVASVINVGGKPNGATSNGANGVINASGTASITTLDVRFGAGTHEIDSTYWTVTRDLRMGNYNRVNGGVFVASATVDVSGNQTMRNIRTENSAGTNNMNIATGSVLTLTDAASNGRLDWGRRNGTHVLTLGSAAGGATINVKDRVRIGDNNSTNNLQDTTVIGSGLIDLGQGGNGQFRNEAKLIADGFGVEQGLTVDNIQTFQDNRTANTFAGAGYFAQNSGALQLTTLAVTGDTAWGDVVGSQDLINSIEFTNWSGLTNGDLDVSLLALDRSDVLSVGDLDNPIAVFEITGSNGLAFSSVDLSIMFDAASLAFSEAEVAIFHNDGGGWVQLASTVDEANDLVSASTTSFSQFAIAQGVIPEPASLALFGIGLMLVARRHQRVN